MVTMHSYLQLLCCNVSINHIYIDVNSEVQFPSLVTSSTTSTGRICGDVTALWALLQRQLVNYTLRYL